MPVVTRAQRKTVAPSSLPKPKPRKKVPKKEKQEKKEKPKADVIAEKCGYSLIEVLGEGSFGKVYRVRDKAGKEWAMKIEKAKTKEVDVGSLTEGAVNIQIHHPNVLTASRVFFDCENPQALVLVTPIANAGDLKKYLAEHSRSIPVEEKLALAEGIGRGLTALHRSGYVHHDFKPENIFLTRDPESKALVPLVADFGLAGLAIDRPSLYRGTRAYMSPEYLCKEPWSPASDLWALGATFMELFYNQPLVQEGKFNFSSGPFVGVEDSDDLLQFREHVESYGRPSAAWLAAHPFCQPHVFESDKAYLGVKGLENVLGNEKLEAYKRLYGPAVNNAILTVISNLVRFDPKDRVLDLSPIYAALRKTPPAPDPYRSEISLPPNPQLEDIMAIVWEHLHCKKPKIYAVKPTPEQNQALGFLATKILWGQNTRKPKAREQTMERDMIDTLGFNLFGTKEYQSCR